MSVSYSVWVAPDARLHCRETQAVVAVRRRLLDGGEGQVAARLGVRQLPAVHDALPAVVIELPAQNRTRPCRTTQARHVPGQLGPTAAVSPNESDQCFAFANQTEPWPEPTISEYNAKEIKGADAPASAAPQTPEARSNAQVVSKLKEQVLLVVMKVLLAWNSEQFGTHWPAAECLLGGSPEVTD